MKLLKVLMFTMFCTSIYAQQSGFGIINSSNRAGVSQLSMGNAWIGSQVQYDFNDANPLADNFLFNAKVLYSVPTDGKVNMPIIGNIGLPLSGALSNVKIGVFPWGIVSENETLTLIVHGGLEYTMFPNQEIETSKQEFDFLGGIEAAFWLGSDGLPLTLSFTPRYSIRNLEFDNLLLFEITGVLPISNGLGFMVDAKIPAAKEEKTVISVGIVVNNPVGI